MTKLDGFVPPPDFDVHAYCERLAKAKTEHAHQRAFFAWLGVEALYGRQPDGWMMYAVPNGGNRDIVQAARLKAEGVRPGVPDTCWPVPCGQYAGLYIEFKKAKGHVSDDQVIWLAALAAKGYAAAVCWGWEAGTRCLLEYQRGAAVATEYR